MSNEQVNSGTPRYPVDRYLVERSNKLEMVNITDDDIWKAEPALRPEDEIVLKKLQDMLQSTADDLKLLSGELSTYHKPGVQVKSLPTPLDDDFNEKVHIEELVDAKFHGHKFVTKSQHSAAIVPVQKNDEFVNYISTVTHKPKKVIEVGVQVKQEPILKKPVRKNNLAVTRTKVIQINECNRENAGEQKENTKKPTVAYKEFAFQYSKPNNTVAFSKPLQVQIMPSINIRGELKEQKVLHLNIDPGAVNIEETDVNNSNVAVISVQHKSILPQRPSSTINFVPVQCPIIPNATCSNEPKRKFSKMSSCESSDFDSNNKINLRVHSWRKIRPQKKTKTILKPPQSEINKHERNFNSIKESANTNLNTWKNKLNAMYGCTTSSRKYKSHNPENKAKKIAVKPISPSCNQPKKNLYKLNNSEYIPYSKLTLGGVRVSDIEKELSDLPKRNDLTLGPILNKILSRENSFHNESTTHPESPKILTTSDENLLQEVLDIEREVSKIITKNSNETTATSKKHTSLNETDEHHSYADDFEEENFDESGDSDKQNQLSDDILSDERHSKKMDEIHSKKDGLGKSQDIDASFESSEEKGNIQNKTYTKILNLSLKRNVDVFEFVPNIDTQDTGTQSNTIRKISLKETQTSPRNDRSNIQPIHNDLRPYRDPKVEMEELFQLEKDFIKKLIVDEYGDLLEKTLNKPSTSQSNKEKNTIASQKNTQTSPAHVKSVMTSPTRTKTRTTSPFALTMAVEQQTTPMQEELLVNIEDRDDLGISINLSSPRFSLRLPQNSSEVIPNIASHTQPKTYNIRKIMVTGKNAVSSSSSADSNYSSSDISSLGEVTHKLKRLRKPTISILSELSSSTSVSKCSWDVYNANVPLRSEGEVSWGQEAKGRKSRRNSKSEGEVNM